MLHSSFLMVFDRLWENEWEGEETVGFAKLGSSLFLNCHCCNRTSRAHNEDDRLLFVFKDKVAEVAKSESLVFLCA